MKFKYLLFDILKLAVPVIIAQYLPSFPQAETVITVLYIFAAVLGVDSVQKTIKAKKAAK